MRTRTRVVVGAALATVLAAVGLPTTPAGADTDPIPPTPATVSSDVLPAPQVDGVVWSQVVIGDRVFATGKFGTARPFGAAPGTQQVTRGGILAYDLKTGTLVPTWAPILNGQGLALAASPDGTRVYVAGDFTTVNGVTRNRIAAIDTRTGALVDEFHPSLNARARALAVAADGTVYAGGSFTAVAGVPRQRLAAFTPSGTVRLFYGSADLEVLALTAPPGQDKLVVGGRFTTLTGVPNYGLGAVTTGSGRSIGFAANRTIRNGLADAAIYSLASDATQVFGTGYSFGHDGVVTGNFEGSFAASAATGDLQWVNGCLGDTYSVAVTTSAVYTVGHSHNCSAIGAFGEQKPREFQRAFALGRAPDANGKKNVSGPFTGRAAPDVLHWLPTLTVGTVTAQGQAAWSVAATDSYVLLGGEFPKVDGVDQQGLARMAVRSLAPNKQGPIGFDGLTPVLTGAGSGKVTATWTAEWDRDNARLTYELLRGPTLDTSVVVSTQTVAATWWNRPKVAFTDTVPAGSTQVYRVRATDPLGNSNISTTATTTAP